MTDLYGVLADQTRRDIVSLLRSGAEALEMSVGQLVEALKITQPTVSKHLKVLRDAGVVQVREEGQHRYYRFDPAPLAELREWVLNLGGGSAPSQAQPFVDLEILGRATGSLVADTMARVQSVVGRFPR